jgi:hydrogenase maturation protease
MTTLHPPADGSRRSPRRSEGDALEATTGDVLVLGVGNQLLRDDGVGGRVAAELARLDLPAGVRAVDGGTLGRDLLPLVATAAALVIVDAVDLGVEPGTVAVLCDDAVTETLAGHGVLGSGGIGDLIAHARLAGRPPEPVVIVAIQPASIEPGTDLTAAIEAAVPRAVELAAGAARAVLAGRSVDEART